ncbi:MAG: hypothetical protein ACE5JS_21335, partial [Nitrospinota bacterium]
MGGSTRVEAPQPSPEEIAIQREQLELMRQSRREQDLLRPFVLQQLGLVEVGGENIAALEAKRRQLEDALGDLPELSPADALRDPGAWATRAGIERAIADINMQIEAARSGATYRRMTEEERLAGMTPVERQAHENLKLRLEREERALRGELPVSEGLIQTKEREFRQFKEAMARAGNPIEGETPETATATTTPGVQALRAFRERFGVLEEAERRGELTAGSSAILQRMGITADISAQRAGMFAQLPTTSMRLAQGFAGLLEP